ncbi:MarR family winged helix-turn-helix transcriptional regulator [Tenggerimyces flavus]|uniref:MarR family winged helix-turn-helix transcriptional regulator n=1 Tax=Tenggerimyces flavus TaxID=1708749 RepID=A0ABV7YBU5_9ACTN|nr:MarR family transcriptional regulator [Tenggerimyces flavus]MBM7786704.1 DNA-binding MarR family transcriptional regulator [Tenggerimyces flavus]
MRDSVDERVERLHRDFPTIDPVVQAIAGRMLLIARELDRRAQAGLDQYGLELWAYKTLMDLRRRGEPYEAKPSELATSLRMSPAAMTKRLDSLERAGYVRRATDPHDRRSIVVTLTDEGRQAFEGSVEAQSSAEEELLGTLTPSQRGQLASTLRKLVLALEPD